MRSRAIVCRKRLLAPGAAALLVVITMTGSTPRAVGPTRLVFTGTFTDKGADGIYAFRFDESAGTLTSLGLAASTESPAWIAVHPDGRHLYAANEIDDGQVSAFTIDRDSGRLTFVNRQSALGARPCHFSIDPTGRALIVASYDSGTVAVLPIAADGRLGAATTTVHHVGAGVNPARQEGPHAHQAVFDPSGRFVLVVDLGLDRVFVYRYDAAKDTLVAHSPASASTAPGAGPRHLVFSKDGRRVYVINELANTISTFSWNADTGVLMPTASVVSTLPAGFSGSNSTAEIVLHPSGTVLYGSNRGHDTIARFAIDSSGGLQVKDFTPIGGSAPRHFAIDPSGRWLLAAGQTSNTLAVFAIRVPDGRLEPVGTPLTTPTPVCVAFLPE